MIHPNRIAVIGVGNLLLSDDGVGVHAIRELAKTPDENILHLDIGTAILHGLPFLESAYRVLLLDAVSGSQAPGTLYLFEEGHSKRDQAVTSMHALSLSAAYRLLYPRSPAPSITVLGIQPESIGFGFELTPTLQRALPYYVQMAARIVNQWLAEPRKSTDEDCATDAPSPRPQMQLLPLSI